MFTEGCWYKISRITWTFNYNLHIQNNRTNTHTQCSLNTHCTLHSVHCTLYITHYYWQWIFARYNVKSTTFIDNINWYILQLIWSLRGFETSNSQAAVYTKDLGKMHTNFSYTQHTHTNSWVYDQTLIMSCFNTWSCPTE